MTPASDADAHSAGDAGPGTRAAEVHVAGVFLQASPAFVGDIVAAVAAIPRAEVTHATADGRVVAVLEAASTRAVLDQIDALRAVRGVLNVAMVYQHAEPADDMDRELQA